MKFFRYAATLVLLLAASHVQAALDDTCTTAGGLPGQEDLGGQCIAVPTPDYGIACTTGEYYNGTTCVSAPADYASCSNSAYYYDGASCVANPTSQYQACQSNGAASTTHFFNGSSCVANSTSSGSCTAPATWENGQCATPPVVPTIPTAPSGSLGNAAGSLPSVVAPGAHGGQQPICINSSPIIGAGMFVIAGSTLCYGTAADTSGTSIYAYHTDNGTSQGGVIQTNTWNGLNVQDLFAQGNITALGQLRVYGGAQIYSPDQKTGLVVVDGKVLAASSDNAGNSSQLAVTPDKVLTTASNGTNSGSLAVTATNIAAAVTDGTASTALELEASKASLASLNGNNVGSLSVSSNKVATAVSDGTSTTEQNIEADEAVTVSRNGSSQGSQVVTATTTQSEVRDANGLSKVASSSNKTSIITQAGLGGSPSDYTSIDSTTTQIINRANSGNNYTQTIAGSGSYVIEASNGPMTSRVNVDSSAIRLISGNGGTMASNGMTGTTSGVGSGAIQIHQSAQTIASNTTIGNLLEGKSYQNKVNGNLFVDGNVYINGTLEYVSSNAATTTVTSTAGSSILGATLSTSGGTSTVMKDTDATHATVDKNGKIALVPGVSAQSSSALTLTNGLGNTHGFIVNETQATMSGGINSSSMTLNDNGATFSNSSTGMPVQVHGVADGSADYDAVNVRQLRQTREQLSAGIAGISAMANIPNVDTGKKFSMGAGLGHYQNSTSLAIGSSFRVAPNTVIRASVAGTDGGSSRTTTYGLGVGVSW